MFGFFERHNPFRRRPQVYYLLEPEQDGYAPPPPPPTSPETTANATHVGAQTGAAGDEAKKKSDGGGFLGMLENGLKSIAGFFMMIFKAIAGLFEHHDDNAPQAVGQQTPQNRQVLNEGPAQSGNAPVQQAPAVKPAQKPSAATPANPAPGTKAPSDWPYPVAADSGPAAETAGQAAPAKAAPEPAQTQTSSAIAAPELNTREKLVLAEAANNLSLADFKDNNPAQGSVTRVDHDKLAGDLQNMQNISFYNSASKQFESIKTGSPAELTAALANDTDKRFRVDLGDGKAIYLQQILQVSRDENQSGFAGGSFRITDEAGKSLGKEAVMGFAGYTGHVDIGIMSSTTDGTAQSRSMEAISHGLLNPQAPEAANLAAATLKAMGPDAAILTASDSMGTSNMRVAGAFLKGSGVNVQEISLEPVADTTEVARIKDALADQTSALHQQFAKLGVSEAKMPDLVDQASAGGIDIRTEFQRQGRSYYTAEAGIPIGGGLLGGMDLMGIKDGAGNVGAGNGTTADTQLHLNLTNEGMRNAAIDGHTGVYIMKGLMDKNAEITVEQAGAALKNTNMMDARNGASSQSLPSQPAAGPSLG